MGAPNSRDRDRQECGLENNKVEHFSRILISANMISKPSIENNVMVKINQEGCRDVFKIAATWIKNWLAKHGQFSKVVTRRGGLREMSMQTSCYSRKSKLKFLRNITRKEGLGNLTPTRPTESKKNGGKRLITYPRNLAEQSLAGITKRWNLLRTTNDREIVLVDSTCRLFKVR